MNEAQVTVVPAQPGWNLFYLCGPGGPVEVSDREFEPIVAWKITLGVSEGEDKREYYVTEPITASGSCSNEYILIGPQNQIIDGAGDRFDTLKEARLAHRDIEVAEA